MATAGEKEKTQEKLKRQVAAKEAIDVLEEMSVLLV